MKVMVIVKATKDSEAGVMPSQQLLTDMGNYNQELAKAGVMLAGEGLHPSSKGARVRFSSTSRTVIDGPFAETKELIAGYWLWRVNSLQDAIDWLKRCPNPHPEDCEIEIRQVFDGDDFGAALTPELRRQEAAVRAQGLGLDTPRFEHGGEMILAGLNRHYSFDARGEIPAQWEKFAPHIGKISGQIGKDSYGICWNNSTDGKFDYLLGVAVNNPAGLPADFTHMRIPAGEYAVFSHRQAVSSIAKTIDLIWKSWVSDAGLKIANAPCFERYTEEFNPQTGMGGIEIWIPLES